MRLFPLEYKCGFPVVNCKNIFEVLEELGIRQWPTIDGPMKLSQYTKRKLTEKEVLEVSRFAPDTEVEIFRDPEGEPFVGFRATWRHGNGCVVFTLLPGDLIPVAAEFRHGAKVISLIFPGGVKEDNDLTLASCAKREFEAETGIILQDVVPLDLGGTPLSARGTELGSCSFLGILPEQIIVGRQDLDRKEFLKIVLVPLKEWMKLIEAGQVKEAASIVATFLALGKLGRLSLI